MAIVKCILGVSANRPQRTTELKGFIFYTKVGEGSRKMGGQEGRGTQKIKIQIYCSNLKLELEQHGAERVLACLAQADRIFTPDAYHKNNEDSEELPKDRKYPQEIKEMPPVQLY